MSNRKANIGPRATLLVAMELSFAVFTQALKEPEQFNTSTIYRELSSILAGMKELHLGSYQGKTYRELRLLRDYVGRMGFDRQLNVTLRDAQTGASAGLDQTGDYFYRLPTAPQNTTITFRLQGIDGRKVLIYTFGTFGDLLRTNRLNSSEMMVYFGSRDSVLHTPGSSIKVHYRASNSIDPTLLQCPDCGGTGCRSKRIKGTVALHSAYEIGGVRDVWYGLDKIWADLALARPLSQPLNPELIEIRCLVHGGGWQFVKIITTTGVYIGTIDGLERDDSNVIKIVQLWSTEDYRYDLKADTILEIVPYRPSLENVARH